MEILRISGTRWAVWLVCESGVLSGNIRDRLACMDVGGAAHLRHLGFLVGVSSLGGEWLDAREDGFLATCLAVLTTYNFSPSTVGRSFVIGWMP